MDNTLKKILSADFVKDSAQLRSDYEPNFEDLFDLNAIQDIQDALCNATGISSLITKPDGTPITTPSNFCELCNSIIRKTEEGLRRCMASDAEFGKEHPDGPQFGPCLSAGLMDGGVPIMFNDTHVANWLIGQILPDNANLEIILAYGETIGADMEQYRAALAKVPRMSEKKFASIINLLDLFGKLLSEQAMQNYTLAQNVLILSAKENELENNNDRLELLIDQIEKAHSDLTLYANSFSHELKTPLVTISGNLGILRKGLENAQPERVASALARIEDASKTMNVLLNSLLSISDVESDAMHLDSSIDLESLLQTLRANFKASLQGCDASLEIETNLPTIVGNKKQIKRLFYELIDNAIKFRRADEKLTIRIGVINGSAFPSLFISDNGQGIDPRYQERIFTMFEQLDKKVPGCGTGLALCRRIVENHGGRIRVEALSHDKGTRFVFTLPGA